MFTNKPTSRRTFLRHTGQLALSSGALPFALNLASMGEAAAFNAPAGDYKALVCVYLGGGNDYGNTVVPFDATSYGKYNAIRSAGTPSIALAQGALTALAPATAPVDLQGVTRQYALHPAMTGMRDLFNVDGKMAVMLNVGPLVEPTNRTEFEARTKRRPPQLFSHDDQTTLWESPDSVVSKYGWGGKTNSLLLGSGVNAGAPLFTCISTAGNALLLSGTNVNYKVDRNNGAILIRPANNPYGSTAVGTALKTLMTQTGAHKLEEEYKLVTNRALTAEVSVKAALALTTVVNNNNTSTVTTPQGPVVFPNDNLGQQLRMVARLISGRSALGNPARQIFFVEIGGFDMHGGLIAGQQDLLGRVSAAMTAFYRATETMGVANSVTSFTASDFGRTLAYNGDGTDHGWGSHHFVVGGAVVGKKFYGTAPPVSVTNTRTGNNTTPYDADSEWHVGDGRLIPTTSVDQYAGTLAKWFGVTDAEMPSIFPNINNFGVTYKGINYAKDLGFMG